MAPDPQRLSTPDLRTRIGYGPVLAIPFAAAVVALTYYRIDRKGHRANLERLAARSPRPAEQGEEP